jgi:hypothetical protein
MAFRHLLLKANHLPLILSLSKDALCRSSDGAREETGAWQQRR